MERFTNNGEEFINQIKSELLEYELEEGWNEIFTYLEIPYFLGYAFSYNWSVNSKKEKYRLKRKEWNAEYDHSRFDKGIYNLDRLAVIEKEIRINSKDEINFKSIEWDAIDKVEFKGIVLDGLMCELQVHENGKSFKWNIDDEMNPELTKLVYTMRNWKREMKEL